MLQSFGFYKPHYNLDSSDQYERRLDQVRERQKAMLKGKNAATCNHEWVVNGSKAEGRKQINQTLQLMLRAFNGECDGAVSKVNYKNVKVMETRIEKAAAAINSLTQIQSCSIAPDYVALKMDKLHLVHEYEEKLQQEKEQQKRIREQMREEEASSRELERAKAEAEREEMRYAEALEKARKDVEQTVGEKQKNLLTQIAELEEKLEATREKERAIARAQLTRAGHVYVISNIGSFGEGVYKIAMTRRLVPQDRIDELGDASVPFEFDVHAVISTADAPALENALHLEFDHRRVNRVNTRKEFFRASLEEIADVVNSKHGSFELTRVAEAADFRKALARQADEETANADLKANKSKKPISATPPSRVAA